MRKEKEKIMSVRSIVVEGGPCGGKSTGLVRISDALLRAGYYPLIVPEVPTFLIVGGVTPSSVDFMSFQRSVIRIQHALEKEWRGHAEEISRQTGKTVVLLFDRAIVSPLAYLESENAFPLFTALLQEVGIQSIEEAYQKYDAVIHLVTAADGAVEFYTLMNNKARLESPEEAVLRDARTKDAWLAHSHFVCVANTEIDGRQRSFDAKLHYATEAVLHALGEPPVEIEEKYMLNSFHPEKLPVSFEVISIVQTYLVHGEPNVTERVRKRAWRGGLSFVHGMKELARTGGRLESESFIGGNEYEQLLGRTDPKREALIKDRFVFVWIGQRFEVDVFKNRDVIYMEREKLAHSEATALPPFIDIQRNVTNEPFRSNHSLALLGRRD